MASDPTFNLRAWARVGAAFLLLLLLQANGSVFASAISWDNGGGDGAWATAANWSGDLLPASADDVTFASGLGTSITLSTGELANTLLFSGNGYTLTAGDLTLTNGTITVDDGTAGSITAAISSVLKGTTLTKAGADTLFLSGANTYTGLTTVSAGVLNIQNATALGTTAGGTTVTNGAALEIQGGITVAGEALTLNGNGLSNGGALRNISGANSFNGTITLGSAARVNSDVGTLTIAPASGNAFAGAFALTLGGAGNIIISKVIATGAGTITKDGTGTLTLLTANTYTGLTTVSAGVLNIQSATALGTSAAGTVVADGAALQMQGNITVAGEALTLSGTGISGTGALRNISGTGNYNGNITLAADARINSDSGTLTIAPATGDAITGNFNLTLGGASAITISKALTIGGGSLAKDGAGTLTLSGTNTYTGTTSVNAGVLYAQSNSALGTSAGGTVVASGAALQLSGGITITDEALTLNGTGIASGGALRSISGNNFYNGNITLASAARINSDAGLLTLSPSSGAAISGAFNLTLGGVGNMLVAQPIAIGSGTLTKDGAGTVTLTGANTYAGLTTVSVGVLDLQNSLALGTTAAGTTVTSGAALQMQAGITVTGEALTLNGTGISSGGALRSVTGNNNYNGNITLGLASRVNSDSGTLTITPSSGSAFAGAFGLTLGGAGNIVVGAPIATGVGTLTKDGTGTVILSAGNTFTGATTIAGGTLQLAYAANSSMLSDTAALTFTTGTLDLAGTVAHTEIVGSTTVNGVSYITRSAGSSVINLNAITVGALGSLDIAGNGIATTDKLNDASGILGAWATVNGSWAANSTNGADGAIVAYTGYADVARLGGLVAGTSATNLRITDTANTTGNITLTLSGTTTLNTLQDSASGGTATIDIGAGNILRLGSGGLFLTNGSGGLTFTNTGTLTVGAANNTAGALYLQNQSTTNPITINTAITNNGTGILTLDKTIGNGTVILAGANTYTGVTNIDVGALNVQNNSALGTTAGGTVVLSGGALELQTGITITGEALTLNGTGVNNGGALRNVSGNNTFAGNITLAAATRVNSDAGTLTIDPASGNAFAGTFNLTLGGAGNITINDVIATSTGTLTKDGTGTLTLSAANTYTGLTMVSAGVLNIQNATATGTTAGGVVVANGAELDIQGGITVGVEALTVNGTGTGSSGVLRNISGANTWGGAITLAGSSTVGADAGSLTVSGVISGIGMNLAKVGAGSLVLSGANTYTGLTDISAGVLNLRNSTGLGTSAGGTTVANGAALELQNVITVTGETLSIAGTGISNGGALRNISGANSFNGAITLAADSRINSDSGTLTITPAAGSAITGNFNLTLGGAGAITITKPITIGSGTITEDGSGTVTLSGVNTYTGLTTVSSGVLAAASATALGSNVAGTTVATGAALQLSGTITIAGEALSLSGTGISSGGALRNTVNNNSFNGNITLAADARINSDSGILTIAPASGDAITGNFNLTLGGAGAITISKSITTGGALTKDGVGTVTLSAANSYSGLTNVSAGVLAISNATGLGSTAAGTTVAGGAALQLSGTITIAGEALTLSGTGIGGGGALRNTANSNSFNGNITLAADTRINSDSGTLTITPASGDAITGNFNLTLGGLSSITIGKPITTGSGALTKDGAGTVTLTGANTYTGLTSVSAGVLNIQNATALGTSAGGTIVASGAALQIQSAVVTGEALTLSGTGVGNTGALREVTGSSSFNGNITLAADTRINSDAGTLTITPSSGDAITGNFNLTLGGAGNITIGGPITISSGGLTKDGAGTLTLSGANTYTGLTTVSVGVLSVLNSSGLGTSAAGTSVTSGAALQLQGGITIGNEALTLNGTGITSGGALRNISGNNSFNGNITLGSATRINSDAGLLTINPSSGAAITGTNVNLTLGGAGNTQINQAISLGSGTLTKDGAGTATLMGANSYTGLTTISVGTINIQNSSGLGSNLAGTSVTSGAALQLQGGITVSGEALTLNGTGVAATGALRSISGSNNYSGNITLGSATRINSDAGLLTINPASGSAIAGTNQNLALGGAGNMSINGAIATGTGTFTKDGNGSVTLTGANTFTGSTTLSGGTLQLAYTSNNSMLSDTAALILTGGTLDLAGSVTHSEVVSSTTVNGNVSITRSTGSSIINLNLITYTSGALSLSQDGIATTDNLNDATGILGAWITVNGQFAANASNTANGFIIAYNGYINIPRLGGAIADGPNTNVQIVDIGNTSGNITMAAGGLTAINSLRQGATGGTATIDIGAGNTLRIASGGILLPGGFGSLTFNNSGTLTAGTGNNTAATLLLDNQDATSIITINAVIADNGTGVVGLSKTNGSGTAILGAANTYTGLTQIAEGTLLYGASNVIASGGVTVNGATAILNLGANHTDTVGTITLDNGGSILGTGTSALTSTGAFDLRSGTVTAILDGAGINLTKTTSGTVTLSGANTYTGLTTISGGTLALGASDALGSGGLTVTGATAVLDMAANHSDSVGTVIVDNSGTILGSGTSTLTSTGGFDLRSGTIAAILAGSVNLTKTTSGTVTLSGANTYVGSTIISAGTLAFGASNVLGNGTLTVDGGSAVLSLGANQSDTAGTVTLDNGGSITGTGTSTLTSSGSFELKNGTVTAGLGGSGIALNKTTSGNVTLSGANSYTGQTTISAGTLTLNRATPDDSAIVTDGNTATTSDILINGGSLVLAATEQIGDTGSILLSSGSLSFSGSGLSEAIDRFANSGGTFTTSANTLIAQSGITFAGGVNTIGNGGTVSSGSWIISGGTITVNGGAIGGALNVSSSGAGLIFTGTSSPTITLDSSNSVGGTIVLGNDLVVDSGLTSGTAQILNGGSLTNSGTIDLSNGTRTFTINDGSAATDMLISASIANGGLIKGGAGSLVLSGTNTYTGTTTINAGALTLNSAATNSAILTDGDTATLADIVINAGSLVFAASEQIGDSGSIALNGGAVTFSGTGRTETIDTFTNSGGDFSTGANTMAVTSTGTLLGGTYTVNDGGTFQTTQLIVTGGTNIINGGTSGGLIQIQSGSAGTGLYFTGNSNPTITIDSSNSVAGRLWLNNDVYVDAGLTSGTARILSGGSNANPGRVDLNGGNRIFDIYNGSNATDMLISASVRNGGIIKNNTGTLALTGNNTFATLVINAGTVVANGSGSNKGLGGATNITVNNGGTLLTSSAQQFGATTALTLAGGTFNTGGTSQTLGALTLSSSSIIDMGSGTSILHFLASDTQAWSGTLSIYNWSGNPNSGGGTDQIFFGTDNSGLTSAQVGSIVFYSDNGSTLYGNGISTMLLNGELVPVPEPGTWFTGALAVCGVAFSQRKRLQAKARSISDALL